MAGYNAALESGIDKLGMRVKELETQLAEARAECERLRTQLHPTHLDVERFYKDERYEYIKAIIDCGELSWEYRVDGAFTTGKMTHDESVDEWSERDIIDLTCAMLEVSEDQRDIIEIEYR